MKEKLSAKEAMSMNRKDRRRLGKLNGVKIPGIIPPFVKKNWPKAKEDDIIKDVN